MSRLSLDSLSMERQLERENSDTDSSYSEVVRPLAVRRRFQLYHQVMADIRNSTASLKLWLASTLFIGGILVVMGRLGPFTVDHCSVDGSFRVHNGLSTDWAASDFFQINIAAGNLTFAQAKVADTAWDLIVGRGGQAILSLITWKVFADYSAMCMTIQPITFATYRIIFTESEPSISSTVRLLHDFIRYKGLASKLASGFLIYSIVFSLAFPTTAGAATGYVPLNEAFILDVEGNLVPFSSFEVWVNSTANYTDITWQYSNRTYHQKDIEPLGSCVPVKDRYQWGASFLQITVLLILAAVWAIGCLAVLITSHARYRLPKGTEVPKGYQAMGILVESIDDQLRDNVKASTTMDQELKTAIKMKLAGGSISFSTPGKIKTFRQWYARERVWFIWLCFWLTAMLGLSIPAVYLLSPLFFLFSVLFGFVALGTIFSIIVGRTLGSKLIFTFCWIALGVGFGLGTFFITEVVSEDKR
ncbi:hypothetical protein F4802DRAFT_226202 [Xylaria palmicola]|nr:hypothetical protein F4802DRAFT_226202 [Xylaria palmicola]